MMRVVCVVLAFGLSATTALAQDGAPARGEKVSAAQKCNLCHSIGDKATKKVALDEVGTALSADETGSWMTNAPAMVVRINPQRKPAMKAFTNIAPGALDDYRLSPDAEERMMGDGPGVLNLFLSVRVQDGRIRVEWGAAASHVPAEARAVVWVA